MVAVLEFFFWGGIGFLFFVGFFGGFEVFELKRLFFGVL